MELITEVRQHLKKHRIAISSNRVRRNLHADLGVGRKFTIREMSAVEFSVAFDKARNTYANDLRLPYKLCVFEVPVKLDDGFFGFVLVARQVGVAVQVTGFLRYPSGWEYSHVLAEVRCFADKDGIATQIIKNYGSKNEGDHADWGMTKVLLFALDRIHDRPEVVGTTGCPMGSAVGVGSFPSPMPSGAISVNSQTTVEIGRRAANGDANAEEHQTRVRRQGTPKREHERRGHWRVYKKSGKRVWITAQTVGHRSMGTVQHDYRVT